MKSFKDVLNELVNRWLREDLRNPESPCYIAKLTVADYGSMLLAASDEDKEDIQREFNDARIWYARKLEEEAEDAILNDPIKRKEYEEDMEREWQEIQKEYELMQARRESEEDPNEGCLIVTPWRCKNER